MNKKVSFEQFHYCSWCGSKLDRKSEICSECGFRRYADDPYEGIPKVGSVGAGWSTKVDDPRFAKYQKKQRKVAFIMYPVIYLIIVGILLALGEITLDGEGIFVIGGLGVIFFIFCTWWIFKTLRKGRGWEGTLLDKKLKKRVRTHYNQGTETSDTVVYWDTILIIEKPDKKVKKYVFEDNSQYYEYFNVGDYLLNHQTKNLRYIEKYDKSLDDILFCAACNYPNDIRGNYCQCCGCPLIK